MTCPTCKKEYTNKDELEFLKEIGECFMCDHLRSEVMENAWDTINIGDDEHNEVVSINEQTTTQKGADIL